MDGKNILLGISEGFLLLILLMSSVSAVPHLINYEGMLSDNEGNALTGNFSIVFKIYNAETGGTLLWSETYATVPVKNGIFNVLLGSKTELNLNFDGDYYLGIIIGSDPEMTPRQPLASVGYAYTAETADNATNANTLDNLDSAAFQRRVSGVCSSGFAIRQINENGSVVCEKITSPGGSDSDWNISGNNMYSLISGNVGIGTTSPSAKLDVAGDVKINGNLNLNNNKITNLSTPTNAHDAATKDYVDSLSNISGDLTIFGGDLTIYPSTPTLTGNYSISGYAQGVYVSGKYAYIADGYSGLRIIDISNPAAPTLTGNYSTSGYARGVYVSGKYAYIADYGSGLQIIDISNPSTPTLTGNYSISGYALGVYVSGKYAYIADGYSGLQIIDISNPAAPTLTGNYSTLGNARGVYVSGKYAYIADYDSGLQIIDISNPAAPTLTWNYDTSGNAMGVYVSGKYAYIADGYSGLQIIDISNPAAPTLTGNYSISGYAFGVYVSGKYAYIADGLLGLQIIDISNPAAPTLTGNYSRLGNAMGVYVSGKYAYIADSASGLQIIQISGVDTPTVLTGNVETGDITVTENADIGNDAYVHGGLTVGKDLQVGGVISGGCPHGMTKVGSFCMDKYEASVWSNADCNGTQYGASSDDYPWNDTGNNFAGYACSKPGVKPSGSITWFQAQQACGNAGKRLCTNAEWQMAAAGTPDACGPNACHCEGGAINNNNTGSYTSCISRWGIYDMNGNLLEWVADWTQGAGETDISGSLLETAGPNYGNDIQFAVRDANAQDSGQNFPAAFIRGGACGYNSNAGVFALELDRAPSFSSSNIGFRCCQ